jgi:hypothetical protein
MFKQKLSKQSVLVLPGWTFKWGPGAKEQGELMYKVEQTQGIEHLTPKIYMAFGGTYAMRTLRKPQVWTWRLAADKLKALWAFPEDALLVNQPKFDPEALERYIDAYEPPALFRRAQLPTPLIWELYRRKSEAVHGDPTEQNTMVDSGGNYVFIDWQWHRRPYLPAHRDIDYGKLLQSVIVREELTPALALLHVSPAAWYWAAIHFMRIANRDATMRIWCDRQIEKCVWVRERRRTNNVA